MVGFTPNGRLVTADVEDEEAMVRLKITDYGMIVLSYSLVLGIILLSCCL